MDPFTVALAVFGIQKLRGKSTGRSFRDALLAAGGTQLAGMGGVGEFQAFGDPTQFSGAFSGGNYIGGANAVNATLGQQLGQTFAGSGIQSLLGDSAVGKIGEEGYKPGTFFGTPATKDAAGKVIEGTGIRGLGTGEKILLGTTVLPLVGSALSDTPEEPKPPFTSEDYSKAYATESEKLKGLGTITQPRYTAISPYNYGQGSMYAFNKGGIVDALPKFAVGGINYMPSKITHDEEDENNYVRASGYVEDGSGTGDKDTDTILAQLADGEFVSRSDAVLGAGIMAGASPNNMREMRKLGAAYFYDQQDKFKRIFDLLDASRKTN